MSTFTEDDIITAITNAMGKPDLTEMPLVDKQDALRRGLIHYSQYRPLRRIGVFQTVADQQQYDIASSYSYLVAVNDIFYGATGSDLTGFYGNIYDRLVQISELRDMDTISNESLRVIDKQNLGAIEESNRYETEMLDDFTVALIPAPEDVRDVYFRYSLIKTVADLRESEYQDIVDFTFMVSASDLATKRQRILQANMPGTGFVMFNSVKFLTDQVAETRSRLEKKLGVNSLVIHG